VKLTTRISLFFLTALAAVLAGMSCSIYWLVRGHLMRQVEDFSQSALDTLNAAVEFDADGLDWESNVRRLTFAQGPGGSQLLWAIYEPVGNRVDGSHDSAGPLEPPKIKGTSGRVLDNTGSQWWVATRTLRAEPAAVDRSSTNLPAKEDDVRKRYRELSLVAGVPMDAALASLSPLALALFGISLSLWGLAAIGGRWISRRALAPVTRMAHAAGSISALDLERRLPMAGTKDELDALGQTFNELLDRLQISFEKQARFAAEASHQLRTPLAAILGQLDVVLRRDRTTEEYRNTLRTARQQAEQLNRIVEMLLFLTREDAETSSPNFGRIELRGWLDQRLQSWEQHPRAGDIRVEASADDDLWVSAHGEMLGQALDNLLDNACKYSAPGSAITVSATQTASEVRLAVEDDGLGIAEEDLPHVGEAFFRSTKARERGIGGVGLGLAIVHRILAALHGRLEVQQKSGGGSRFVIILPTAFAVTEENRSLTQPVA
jgi:heavy metal sensor kinase